MSPRQYRVETEVDPARSIRRIRSSEVGSRARWPDQLDEVRRVDQQGQVAGRKPVRNMADPVPREHVLNAHEQIGRLLVVRQDVGEERANGLRLGQAQRDPQHEPPLGVLGRGALRPVQVQLYESMNVDGA